MLSSLEMVSEPSGKTKTLADMIKDGNIITPETPVHTSDDSIELEEYIESLIPEPPAPGAGDWDLVGEMTDIVLGTFTTIPEDILDMIENGDYTDICINARIHESTTGSTYADDVYMNVFDVFKAYVQTHRFIHFAGFGYSGTSFPQQTAPYGFRFDVDDGVLKLWYFGAQYFSTNSVLLDLKFYVR